MGLEGSSAEGKMGQLYGFLRSTLERDGIVGSKILEIAKKLDFGEVVETGRL